MTKLALFTAFAAASLATSRAQTLADWTFETSVPAGTPGAGIWYTNVAAEVGGGTASALHAGNAVYSTPAGNGSAHSFSSTVWAVGDFYQFSTSTVGYNDIVLSFSQTSSGTGPGTFQLEYSTDGVNFTTFGSAYTVLDNGLAPNASWNATTASSAYNFTDDLSSVSAIDNASIVYFRLVDAGTEDAAGTASVGTGGTDRVDNFTVTSAPEPGSIALAVIGGLTSLTVLRRRR